MDHERTELQFDGRVAILRFNDPGVLNAIGAQMLDELHQAVRLVRERESETRCLLITGAGRSFCAGANLTDPGRNEESRRRGPGDTLRGGYHPLLYMLRDLEMPIVTAVNGAAAGIGMSLALMGDIVCASRDAFFLQAFARIGLIPDGGSTFLLPRLIGWGRAVELSLLAERLPAEKAYDWGLVNRLFDAPDLVAGALQIASDLAAGPRSLALIRKAYWQTWDNSYESQLDVEARLQSEAARTADHREGIAAFAEKRVAHFQGR